MVLHYLTVRILCHAKSLDLTSNIWGIDTRYCNTFIISRRIKAWWMNDAILRPKLLTVFQSYEDDGQLIIKCFVRLSPVYNRKYLRLRRDRSLELG